MEKKMKVFGRLIDDDYMLNEKTKIYGFEIDDVENVKKDNNGNIISFNLKDSPNNVEYTYNLQKTCYDTFRFKSETEAEANHEIYNIRYVGNKMIVTNPDGVITELPMNFPPIFGIDVSDRHTLQVFLNSDMEKRDNNHKNL